MRPLTARLRAAARPVEEKPPDFLDDIQTPRAAPRGWLDREHADAIDVEVEVIDLGPAEDAD